ncbi:hypothetical protein ABW20_dc0110010 [Dactylellina cionopaga]|nr:hypothetical protein ABW20_dc0110010 [Dactylellina cionopaga]
MAAATSFNFSVIVIPSSARSNAANLDFPTLNQSLSFALEINTPSDFQTLYSQDSKGGNAFKGLLYVPDLDASDPCDNHDLVPRNATRKANLPLNDLKLIAYAPLITPHCSRQYMYSAENDNVAAFIFYGVPSQYSNDTDPLEEEEDYPFEYPVYYLDGAIGQPLMRKLGEYSANISEVYNGFNLTEAGYDLRDYARIYAVISTKNTNPMPGLWLFLLVVVAVLLFIIGASSLLMHLFQFHYRRILRRRIANGEVDLEHLGVGRITVPREFMTKFPMYVYVAEGSVVQDPRVPPVAAATVTTKEGASTPAVEGSSATMPTSPTDVTAQSKPEMAQVPVVRALTLPAPAPQPSPPLPPATTITGTGTAATIPVASILAQPTLVRGYHQTSCPICLDDFIHQETTVRELPCLHIFHADCIDPYLESQSSLCVLCKQSVLPKGYVPIRLTNAIVRRERLLRNVRDRSRESAANGSSGNESMLMRWRIRRLRRHEEDLMGRQALTRAGMRGSAGGTGYEYRRNGAGQVINGGEGRVREVVEVDPVRPRWRETMDRIFPGFR